jgi:hypothetical protein
MYVAKENMDDQFLIQKIHVFLQEVNTMWHFFYLIDICSFKMDMDFMPH